MIELYSTLIFAFVTSLREVLEAALIIGIVIGYLTKINRKDMIKDVIIGVLSASVLSVILALIFLEIFKGVEGYQELFEGIIMLLAAGVLTWMIFWMRRHSRGIKGELEEKIDRVLSEGERLGIVSLVFFAVFREGAELILLLYAKYTGIYLELGEVLAISAISIGFALGLVISIGLALLLFKSTVGLNLKKFFNITSIILIIFAAGLIAHGIHEIYEYLEINAPNLANLPIFTEVYNINNTFLGEFLESIFGWTYDPAKPGRFEKSVIGGILTGLIGWNDNPAFIELVAFIGYYLLLGIYLFKTRNESIPNKETVQA
ncbi:MAG: Ferrous iron permease EfeU [Candidatus Heimdallarchaeota archaeon LC_3]|nr:MAG: Ferrous iron permease EfeU [Candidatus Heimdallarchaeota archaeon LC_3]